MSARWLWAVLGPALATTPLVAQARAARPALIELFDASLTRLAAEGRFSGTVVVTRDGDPVLERAFGLAERGGGIANAMETRFNVGSMDKMLTAVAILQLARSGSLSLDARLIAVLPGYPNAPVARHVTIHQLLTHTAGLGDFLMKMIAAPAREYRRLEDYLPFFVDEELAFEPGSRWAYSNGGYLALGLVIEAVTGRSYGDVIRDSVLSRAGMASTGFRWPAFERRARQGYAINYSRMMSNDGVERQFVLPGQGGPAGGGYSTTGDLARFARALHGGALLGDWTGRLTSRAVDLVPGGAHRYGYGHFIEELEGITVMGHGGGGPGINGELTTYQGTGYAISVLANIDPPAATNVKRLFDGLLLESTGRLPAPASSGNTEFVLAGYDDARLVSVVGDFTQWQPHQRRLERSGGQWVGRVELIPGRHRYRFFVDGRELVDPANAQREIVPGPLRQEASVLVVK